MRFLIAACVFLLFQSANGDRGLTTCFLGRHAAGDLRLDVLFEVELQFIVELCLDAPGRKE